MDNSVRIDKWLWAARFYKTRTLAGGAVEGGRVHVNNKRVKPSYRIKVGDTVRVSKSSIKQEVVVSLIGDRRGSANEAQTLYMETKESIEQRELYATQRKILNQGLPRAGKKPNKHERRKIKEMLGK